MRSGPMSEGRRPGFLSKALSSTSRKAGSRSPSFRRRANLSFSPPLKPPPSSRDLTVNIDRSANSEREPPISSKIGDFRWSILNSTRSVPSSTALAALRERSAGVLAVMEVQMREGRVFGGLLEKPVLVAPINWTASISKPQTSSKTGFVPGYLGLARRCPAPSPERSAYMGGDYRGHRSKVMSSRYPKPSEGKTRLIA